MARNTKQTELIVMVGFVLLGVLGMLGGELGLEWSGPVAFAALRTYLVASGYLIRERLGDKKGGKITRQWTWGSVILTSAYLFSLWLVEVDANGTTAISLSTMIALQATNIMLVGVEIYFSIGYPKHPAILEKERIEQELDALEVKVETLESEIEKNREGVTSLELKINEKDTRIGELEVEVEAASDVQSKEIEKVRQLEKWKSSYIENASKVSVMGNARGCACQNCGTVVLWGQVKKGDKICPECETVVAT